MSAATGQCTRILIVDDEVRILAALRRCLRREGYEILTAESPGQALDILRDRTIDVVVSDQKMPGMTGLELMEEVQQRYPHTARLLITGWTEVASPSELDRLGVHSLIPKPWDDVELKRALRAAIAERGSPAR